MNFYIQQSININFIKIGSITNSSVLQIGSAGVIRPASYLYNTGEFKEPAPPAKKIGAVEAAPYIPLRAPVRENIPKEG